MRMDVHDRIDNAGGAKSYLGRLLLWWLFDSQNFLWLVSYVAVNVVIFGYGMIVHWGEDPAPYYGYAKGGGAMLNFNCSIKQGGTESPWAWNKRPCWPTFPCKACEQRCK